MVEMGVDIPAATVESVLQEQDSIRNLQKKAKKTRHEQEKDFMETLRGLGSAVGDYVGNGQGESETVTQASTAAEVDLDADVGPSIELDDDDAALETSDDAHPLLFFYDCETTGFSMYNDNITDIAAKVVACPVSLQTPIFSSLVRTSRRIPSAVTKVTGITTTMLRSEKPLSEVFTLFLKWLVSSVSYVNDATDTPHYHYY